MTALETERLHLRPLKLGDLDVVSALHTQPRMRRFIGDGCPLSLEQSRTWLKHHVEGWQELGYGFHALELRDNARFVGWFGLNTIRDHPDLLGDIEIGGSIAPDQWRTGLATEAARAALNDAFARVGLLRVVARFRSDNTASGQMVRRLGMRHTRDVPHLDLPGHTVSVWEALAPKQFVTFPRSTTGGESPGRRRPATGGGGTRVGGSTDGKQHGMGASGTGSRITVAVLGVAAVLGGCSGEPTASTAGAAPTSIAPVPATATSTSPAPSAPSSTAGLTGTPASASTVAPCPTASLRMSATSTNGVANQATTVLLFTNTGTVPCSMRGFPGVTALDKDGHQIDTVADRRYDRGALVLLPPGGQASSVLGGADFQVPSQGVCPQAATLLVYPPDDTASARVPVDTDYVCGLDVETVKAGPQTLR